MRCGNYVLGGSLKHVTPVNVDRWFGGSQVDVLDFRRGIGGKPWPWCRWCRAQSRKVTWAWGCLGLFSRCVKAEANARLSRSLALGDTEVRVGAEVANISDAEFGRHRVVFEVQVGIDGFPHFVHHILVVYGVRIVGDVLFRH